MYNIIAQGWMLKNWRNGGKRGQKETVVITAVDGTTAGKKFKFGCVG